MVEVTHEDINASQPIVIKVMIGELDHEDLHKAFAQHRAQAEARIVAWFRDSHDGKLVSRTALADAIENGAHREGK